MASRKPHARLPSPLGVRARDSRRVSHLQHGHRGLPELSLALATRTIKWLAAAILSLSLIRSRRTHCSICAQGPAPPWRSSDVELHSVPARHRELPTKLGPIFVVSSPCLLQALYRDAAALSSQGRAPRPRRAPAPGREHHLVAPRRCSRVTAGSSATIGDRAPSSSSSATSSSTTSAPRSSATPLSPLLTPTPSRAWLRACRGHRSVRELRPRRADHHTEHLMRPAPSHDVARALGRVLAAVTTLAAAWQL